MKHGKAPVDVVDVVGALLLPAVFLMLSKKEKDEIFIKNLLLWGS